MRRAFLSLILAAAAIAPAGASDWLVECGTGRANAGTRCVLLLLGTDDRDRVDTAVALALESAGGATLVAKAGTEPALPVTWARVEGGQTMRGDDSGLGRLNILNLAAALASGKGASVRWESPKFGAVTSTLDPEGFDEALMEAAERLQPR